MTNSIIFKTAAFVKNRTLYRLLYGRGLCMDENTKERLLDKNKKIINMVIDRVKRDFQDDIAIIGVTGSFNTGDFHEKSDLDLIIINNTDRGKRLSTCFILDDVGYDIYCTSWASIEEQASLKSPMISCLTDLDIIYCAKPEYMEKFNAYKQRALDNLAKPIGKECLERAKKYIDSAKQEYANTLLSDNLGDVRRASAEMLYNLINALVNLNNTCFKLGIKRHLEELAVLQYMPNDFEKMYFAMIDAKTIQDIRDTSHVMLECIVRLYDKMYKDFVKPPVPTYDNLKSTYEEIWCNYRNKVIVSSELNDKSYAYHVARGAQAYLDEMTANIGTKKFDLMQYFDGDNLTLFKEAFLNVMDEYLEEYKKVGRSVERYDSFEQLYNHFMMLV